MRVLPIVLLAFVIAPAAAQDASPSKFQWQSPAKAKTLISVGGNTYETESAGKPWNIQTARNTRSDLTRFEVRAGDQWDEDVASGENKERAELDGYKTRWSSGTNVWGAYSFFVEPGAAYRADWAAINQMHGSKVRAFHVHYNGDTFRIFSEFAGANSKGQITPRYAGAVSRNTWHHVVFHLQENPTNGRLEFWLDGNKIVDFTGPIGASGNQAYWKFGIYRGYGPITTPFAIQFANMEVGTRDLSARIGNPQQTP
jgi:hypothetical protein